MINCGPSLLVSLLSILIRWGRVSRLLSGLQQCHRKQSHPCPRPGIGRVPSPLAQFLNLGCLVRSKLHTSRSIRFELGQKFVVISFSRKVIAITNFSHDTLLGDCAFTSSPICSATYQWRCLPNGQISHLTFFLRLMMGPQRFKVTLSCHGGVLLPGIQNMAFKGDLTTLSRHLGFGITIGEDRLRFRCSHGTLKKA